MHHACSHSYRPPFHDEVKPVCAAKPYLKDILGDLHPSHSPTPFSCQMSLMHSCKCPVEDYVRNVFKTFGRIPVLLVTPVITPYNYLTTKNNTIQMEVLFLRCLFSTPLIMYLHRTPLQARTVCNSPSIWQVCTLVEKDKCHFSFDHWSVICSVVHLTFRSHCCRLMFLNVTFKYH